LALHSALEWHGVANQVFQTVYYFSARARKDVVFENVTFHRAAPPVALARAHKERFQTQETSEGFLITNRERSFVDSLLLLDYSGGVEELDKSLAMFPSFDFDAALEYLKLLRKPWLYSRLGFLLDRHADKLFFRNAARDRFRRHLPPGVAYLGNKRPGNRWVPAWKVMVPETLAPSAEGRIQT
jgi:predicted transcriptional regulator of viral defense system